MSEQSQAPQDSTSSQKLTSNQSSAFMGGGAMLDAQVELSEQPLETDSEEESLATNFPNLDAQKEPSSNAATAEGYPPPNGVSEGDTPP